MTNAGLDELVGKNIHDVQISRLFSDDGAIGLIYEGIWKNAPVLMKVLRPEMRRHDELVERMRVEASIAKNVSGHPNVIEFIGAGELDDTPYIVYKKIENAVDLASVLHAESAIIPSQEELAQVFLNVLYGLKHMHDKKTLHRDMKPANIILEPMNDLHARVCDYGAGKDLKASVQRTMTGQFLGTAWYVAPEQAQSLDLATEKSDLYSLACTGYEMFSRTPPAEDPSTKNDSTKQISNRQNVHLQHELWLDEAIELKRAELEEIIQSDSEDKARAAVLREQIKPLSAEASQLIMMVLVAKDQSMRPSLDMILEKWEKLVKERKIVKYEVSADELTKREEQSKALKNQISDIESQAQQSKQKYGTALQLAQLYESLIEVAPSENGERLTYLERTIKYYGELKAAVKFKRMTAKDSQFIEGMNLPVKMEWLNGLLNYEKARQSHGSDKVQEKTIRDKLTKITKAISEGRVADAATLFKSIDHVRVPEKVKDELKGIAPKLEDGLNSIVESGTEALKSGRFDVAQKAYEQVHASEAVLPSLAEHVRKKAKEFASEMTEIELLKRGQEYKKALGENDFYHVAEIYTDLSKQVESLPVERKERHIKQLEDIFDVLKSKRQDIEQFQLIRKTATTLHDDWLTEQEKKEEKKEENEDDTVVMKEEDMDEYKTRLDKLKRTYTTLDKINVGPKTKEMDEFIENFERELMVPEWKKTAITGSFSPALDAYNSLIKHYRRSGDVRREKLYVSSLIDMLQKRMKD